MKVGCSKISLLLVFVVVFCQGSNVFAWEPRPGWKDSYSVDGMCYCDTTNFDHGIGTKTVLAPDGYHRSVQQICADIKMIYGVGPEKNRIPYNTIACGHGPANDAPDEHLQTGCPGRVDLGSDGCFEIGPEWPLVSLYGLPMISLDRSEWKISAGNNQSQLAAMVDGNPATRWTSGEKQSDGQWIEIDFRKPSRINQIVLDTSASRNDYPRQLRIEDRSDENKPIEIPVERKFGGEITRLVFPARMISKLRVVQTGTTDRWYWSIHELHVGYIEP